MTLSLHKVEPVADATVADAFSRTNLIGAHWDSWLLGGLSLFMLAGFHFFVDGAVSTFKIATIMLYASWLVNFPHFILSYQLLYWDQRKNFLKRWSYIWAGVVVPILLIGFMALGYFGRGWLVFRSLIFLMYFTVGWHYSKQVFGVMVVTSARKQFYLKRIERWALLASLLFIWIMSFIGGNFTDQSYNFHGFSYQTYALPPFILLSIQCGLLLSMAVVLTLFIRRYLKEGRTLPVAAWVSYVALLAWNIPVLAHPHMFYMIPFFHSLQYLVFVWAMKDQEWKDHLGDSEGFPRRSNYLKWSAAYLGIAVIVGLLSFSLLPNLLDRHLPEWNPRAVALWTPTLFLLMFTIFLNVHHYFIDAVLWRKNNDQVRKYLFLR